MTATIKSTQSDKGGQVVNGAGVSLDEIAAFTDDAGDFTIQLLQGATVVLAIPLINLSKEIIVPAENSAVFTELI